MNPEKVANSVTLLENKVTSTIEYEKKHALRIRFRIRAIAQTNEAYILTRITLNGVRCKADFTTGLRLPVDCWNAKSQMVRGKNSQHFNDTLAQIRFDLTHNFEKLVASKRPFSPDCLRKTYVEDIPKLVTLEEISQMVLDMKLRKLELKKLAPSTIKNHTHLHRNFVRIFKETGWNWPLDEIRTKEMEELEIWVRGRSYWHYNTQSKLLKYVKEVMRYGMAEGYLPARPIVLRITFIETEHKALTLDQVNDLQSRTWKSGSMKTCAELFLFQCFTGLAYADLEQFEPELHLKVNSLDEWIELKRKKSPRQGKAYIAKVPLLPAARRILDCHKGKLPVPTNQEYNRSLKLIGEMLGIDFELTSHIARKTFCTILYNLGVSIEIIGEWVGHSTARQTLASYAKSNIKSLGNPVTTVGFGT